MTQKTKDIIYFLRLPLILLIVLVVGGYLILIANGYILNLKAKTIEKTGMIYLKSNPRTVNVYLNNVLKAEKTPARLAELSSGRYDIKISKDGYYDWQKTLSVETGLVNAEADIVLFFAIPQEYPLSDDEKDAFNKLPNPLLNTDIIIKESNEIWVHDSEDTSKDILVTRLSESIKKAAYYSDKKHILFQVKNEIRVVDLDGSNNIKLVTLPSEDTAEFFVDDSGQFLYYKIQDVLEKIKIH